MRHVHFYCKFLTKFTSLEVNLAFHKKMDYCLKITRNSFVSKYSVPATVCIFTKFEYICPTHHYLPPLSNKLSIIFLPLRQKLLKTLQNEAIFPLFTMNVLI